jgi:UV DNA damage endonuclease
MIKYGLVCISSSLRDKDPELAFKTMTRTQFLKMGREDGIIELSLRVYHNIHVTLETVKHCASVGIKHYRISCKLFPLLTDTTLNLEVGLFPNQEKIINKMREIGVTAKTLGVSMSCHPDQFVVLGSNTDSICEKSIEELNFHSWVMDTMGLPQNHYAPINIHPALSNFENPEKFVDKFVKNFFACDIGVRNRLVLENEDKGYWNCANLYNYFHSYMKQAYNFYFPLTLDNLHDKCNPSKDPNGDIIPYKNWFLKFYPTWDETPVFHWSEGIGNTNKHAAKITSLPEDFGVDCTYEIEVKDKDNGFLYLLR